MRLAAALLAVATPAAAQTHALVACGLGGEPRYQADFLASGLAVAAGLRALGVPSANVRLLTEAPAGNPAISGRSTKEAIAGALAELARAVYTVEVLPETDSPNT